MGAFYAGLDVSEKTTAICVIDAEGVIIEELSVDTTPAAIARALAPYKRMLERVGQEAGPKSAWLHKELVRRKYPMVCMDARVAHGALSSKRNKTDENDARGLSQLVRQGWFTPAYIRSDEALRLHLLLSHRRALKRQAISLELAFRGSVKSLGAVVTKKGQTLTLEKQRNCDPIVALIADSLARARMSLLREAERLDETIEKLAKKDPVCRRLMTVPGVGPLIALTFRAGVDDPHRFDNARNVAAYFGLTPRRRQSGQLDKIGRISKMGEESVRSALYEAAVSHLFVSKSASALQRWGLRLARRIGKKAAAVAVARKLAVIMHRMWITDRDFEPAAA